MGEHDEPRRSRWQSIRHRLSADWTTALATIVGIPVAIVAGIWIPLSALSTNIEKASDQNRKLTLQLVEAQNVSANEQRQVNEAIVRAVKAESSAIAALLASGAAEQRVSDLTKSADSLQQEVSMLHEEAGRLAQDNARAKTGLAEAQATSDRLVEASVAFLHNDRYAQYINQLGRSQNLLVPTTEVAADNASAVTTIFMFIDKRQQMFMADKDIEDANGFSIGDFAVIGIDYRPMFDANKGMHLEVKFLPKNDPKLLKFEQLLKSEAAMDLLTYISLRKALPNPNRAGEPEQVIDALTAQFPGKALFCVTFLPGEIGGVSFEDYSIRGFWMTGISASLSRLSRSTNEITTKIGLKLSGDVDYAKGFSFDAGKKDVEAVTKAITDTFGSIELARLRERLNDLDASWIRELSTGRLQFRHGHPFKLDAKQHSPKVFSRWDWNSPLDRESAVLFDTVSETGTADFVLACAGAEFLEDSRLWSGPEAPSTLEECKSGGTGIVAGGNLMTFVLFEMPGGAPLPFHCAEIDAVVTGTNGFRYEFHPDNYLVGPSNRSCEGILNVPDGVPVTISATAPGYVGKPNTAPPPWSTVKGAPVYGWTNPTMFNSLDKEGESSFRSIEMDSQHSN